MRLIQGELSKNLGETAVVENKPGAAGVIAANYVKSAKPDGYTLLVGTASTHGMLQAMKDDIPYDAQKDFAPVALIADVPLVLDVSADVKANNTKEFVELLRQNPEKYTYASSGTGGPLHLAGELFKKVADVQAMHVPYKSSGQAQQELLAGRVSFFFNIAAESPYVAAGTVKRLGVASEDRFAGSPDLRTLKEAGYDVVASSWSGIFAPAGTPDVVVAKIRAALENTLQDPELEKRLIKIGFVPNKEKLDSEKFGTFVAYELKKWRQVVDDAHIERN